MSLHNPVLQMQCERETEATKNSWGHVQNPSTHQVLIYLLPSEFYKSTHLVPMYYLQNPISPSTYWEASEFHTSTFQGFNPWQSLYFKVLVCKVLFYKVLVCKVLVCKVLVCKVLVCKVLVCKARHSEQSARRVRLTGLYCHAGL